MKPSELPQDTPEKKFAVENCLALYQVGSVTYGTNIPGKSDRDYYGFFMPPKDYLLGLKNIEQVEFRTNSTSSGHKNTASDIDCTLYSLPKYFNLLLNNNPNTIETLFIPENCRTFETAYSKKILENKEIFLSSKSYHSFRGYSHSQLARLERSEQNDTGRQELIKVFGYDTKMSSHVLRLYLECNELLSTGKITLPLKENQLVLTVKKGEWDKTRFMEEAKRLEALCDTLYTKTVLAHSPNQEAANDLLVSLTEQFHGWDKAGSNLSLKQFIAKSLRHLAGLLE